MHGIIAQLDVLDRKEFEMKKNESTKHAMLEKFQVPLIITNMFLTKPETIDLSETHWHFQVLIYLN